MTDDLGIEPSDGIRWLDEQLAALTTEWKVRTPSEWAEECRRLPAALTPMPGPFRFDVAPFMREIVDCFSVESPIREVTFMKGAQVTATTGVLENVVGYAIDEVRSAPCMLVTADAEMATQRLTQYIVPMLQDSGLMDRVQSVDVDNKRKRGLTDNKIEWVGGGFLVPFGAQNANKLRSLPIQFLLRDEVDGWPDVVGKDGDPMQLSADRTAAFEGRRKILDISTPNLKGQSKIEKRFLRGDRRYYFVRCLKCGFEQRLRWRHSDKETGEVGGGICWETENGQIVPGSVRYECHECGHPHTNDDKTRLFSPDNGARWQPTNTPADQTHRSYHLSALYSPVGMQTWEACVGKWLAAWDVEHNRVRDTEALRVFYNNVLGETYELRGEKLTYEQVSSRRRNYHFGEVPNELAKSYGGGPILLLTCAVDVHKSNLAVSVFGWSRNRRAWLIDYWRFEGDTENLEDEATWGRLRKLIEDPEPYTADDGKRYRIQLTCIDSGWRADDVYLFASEYSSGVVAVKGREQPHKGQRDRHFSDFTTPMGTKAYGIVVDLYKDRWSAALRREWDGIKLQPEGYFNAPINITDKQLKELTVEVKREKIEKSTGKRVGTEWHRPSGAANELWDTLIYASAAVDIIAWDVCINGFELEHINWVGFYDWAESEHPYFEEPTTNGELR